MEPRGRGWSPAQAHWQAVLGLLARLSHLAERACNMVINIEGGGGGGDQEIHGLDRAHNRLLFTAWRAVAGHPGPWLCPGGGMKKLGGTYNQYRQDNGLVITKDGASWLTSDPLCDTSPQEWRPVRMFLSYLPAAPPRVPSTLPPTPLIAMNRPLSQSLDYIVVTSLAVVGWRMKYSVFVGIVRPSQGTREGGTDGWDWDPVSDTISLPSRLLRTRMTSSPSDRDGAGTGQ